MSQAPGAVPTAERSLAHPETRLEVRTQLLLLLGRRAFRAGAAVQLIQLPFDLFQVLQQRRAPRPNEGLVDWLLACPEKGFFVAIDSESTDTL